VPPLRRPVSCDWCASLLSSCCVYTRTQILVAGQAHQDNFDVSRSRLRRSEQMCSRGLQSALRGGRFLDWLLWCLVGTPETLDALYLR
jgi:hypothetical protein